VVANWSGFLLDR